MRILLPPSAGKTTKESTNHLQLEKLWQAEHLTQTRRQLIDDVQNTALLADAAQIFSSGEPSQGSQGQGNQPQGGQGQLEELTLVFSALFGPVRLTDLITPHRLSGSVKLPGQGSVASIWSKALKELLAQQLSGHVVVDLRSAEYGAMYRPTRGSDCLLLNIGVAKVDPATGKRSVVSHWAKHTRGLLAGALLEAVAGAQLSGSEGDVDEILQVAAGLEGVKEVEITPLDARGQAKVTLVL